MTDASIPRPKRSDPGYQKWWQQANPEKHKAIRDRTRTKNREKHCAYMREWHEKNKEHEAAYAIEYGAATKETRNVLRRAQYAADPEPHRCRDKLWRKNNPIKRKAARARRRARIRKSLGTHTSKDIEAIFSRQRGLCANPYCRLPLDLKSANCHVDHIMALANGGTNWPDNLQILDGPCNQRKTNLHMTDWLDRERKRAAYLQLFIPLLAAFAAALFQE